MSLMWMIETGNQLSSIAFTTLIWAALLKLANKQRNKPNFTTILEAQDNHINHDRSVVNEWTTLIKTKALFAFILSRNPFIL